MAQNFRVHHPPHKQIGINEVIKLDERPDAIVVAPGHQGDFPFRSPGSDLRRQHPEKTG